MLQEQFDEIKSYMSRNHAATTNVVAPAPAAEESNTELVSRISALQELLETQTSQLEELRIDRELLLEENKLMKEQINSLNVNLSALRDRADNAGTTSPNILSEVTSSPSNFSASATKHTHCTQTSTHSHKQHNTLHTQSSSVGSNERSSGGSEGGMLIISGFVDCEKAGVEPEVLARVVLGSILPAVKQEDIISVSELRSSSLSSKSRSSTVAELATSSNSPADASTRFRCRNGLSARDVPSLLLRLTSVDLAREILLEKRRFTAFSVADLDVSSLRNEVIKHLLHVPIFINEYLCHDLYKEFSNLKIIAKNLGFKFIWHRRGKFLVRRREGERSFTFTSAADLAAIRDNIRCTERSSATVNSKCNSSDNVNCNTKDCAINIDDGSSKKLTDK